MARRLPGVDQNEVSRSDGFAVPPERLTIIGLDASDDGVFDDERANMPLGEAFIANIMSIGVKVPISVTTRGERLIVVDGRQRVRAAREANRRLTNAGNPAIRVPIKVENLDDSDAMLFGITLNEARQADAPHIRAEKAARLYRKTLDKGVVANAFQTSIPTVSRWIRYAEEACEELKEAVSSGKISFTLGVDLSALPLLEQRDQLAPKPSTEAARPAPIRSPGARKGVKHTSLRKMLTRDDLAPPPPEFAAVLRWVSEGTPLPSDHPLAAWVVAAEAEKTEEEGS